MDTITALAFLTDAVERRSAEAIRTDEVNAALKYLASIAPIRWPFTEFEQGLVSTNLEKHWQMLDRALTAIKLTLGSESIRTKKISSNT